MASWVRPLVIRCFLEIRERSIILFSQRPFTNPFDLNDVGGLANPTFVDIDGDGDLDAFVGGSNSHTMFFKNTGSADNPIFGTPVDNPFGLFDISGYGISPNF